MAPSISRRIVLIVLLGAVLPLALVGLWTTRAASRSGRDLLRSQLDGQLAGTVQDVLARWEQHKGDLLVLGESEPARVALRDGAIAEAPSFVRESFLNMTAFNAVTVRDRDGRMHWLLEGPGLAGAVRPDQQVRGIPVRVVLTDLSAGDTIGSIEASLRVAALLQSSVLVASAAGPLTAVFEGDRPLVVPSGADERLFRDDRFEWSGQRWLAVRRSIPELGIDLLQAGALTPYEEPFERSAMRGALALLAAASAVVVVIVVATRRMSRDVERQLAQREALAAVGEFASELAHEVRNPLTAIRLDLQRVEESADDEAVVRGIVPRVLQQIDRMDRAVRGALRVTRSGSMNPTSVELRDVLDAACRSATPEFARRGASLTVDLPATGVRLDGDPGALEQMFLNLLINAAQALAPDGNARVGAERRNGAVHVTITDIGAGMTAEQLRNVSEPYRSSRRDGTGLGLKIARRIVTSHHGTLELVSAPGEGTTVRVSLPVT